LDGSGTHGMVLPAPLLPVAGVDGWNQGALMVGLFYSQP